MKIEKLNAELQAEIKEMLEKAEDKSAAICEAANMIVEAKYKDIIDDILEQSAKAQADESYRKSLGLHTLSKEETEFYELVTKDIKQAITGKQIDILPTSIVDRTLADIKSKSDLLSLVKMAPAGVTKWLSGSHTGTAVWGALTDAIKGEITAAIDSLNLEQCKLTVYMVIPKSIRELALPFVDKYLIAVLAEAMQDGLEVGYLTGNGKTGPIGITNQIAKFKADGTASAKDILSTVTKFSPKGLANVRKILTNNGKRVVSELHLICNPLDEAEYVDPALFGEALVGGYRIVSFMPIIKHPTPNCPKGKGIFTIKDAYTMGCTGVSFNEYDQTKAMDDADLVIGKSYANGRADDDNTAVVFDITKLEEYVLPVTQATTE